MENKPHPAHWTTPWTLPEAQHIVLDLETLSLATTAEIICIGAVIIDGHGTCTNAVSIPCRSKNDEPTRHHDPDTLLWWAEQAPEAQAHSYTHPAPHALRDALLRFSDWKLANVDPARPCFIWGNGSGFDCATLRNAYEQHGLQVPWENFWERCLRTALDLHPLARDIPFDGLKHVALHDARHEAKQLAATIRHLRGLTTTPGFHDCAGGCAGGCKTATQPSEATT